MNDEDLIPISALQHFLYCPRQCALIHIEQLWTESRHTAEGRLMHERIDQPQTDRRGSVRIVTAMPLVDLTLGITGLADVVEFHRSSAGEQAYPVEYKRGRPKVHRADEVQLCAQAMCLESMLRKSVPGGALFYGQTRRRKDVAFDEDLRALTRQVVSDTRAMIKGGITPMASYEPKRCDACSLIDLCQPGWLPRGRGIDTWLRRQLED
ncbi:CRISPR-associated protein Cas4 [Candidimonas nitroreducens]|uniref:CRISPR-associated exonuclease Cas4 n=1 Tax=Candidimonas nitroreducens TaxID=683354 RepID=A0A225MSM5_9BURK|nr:CRISPR-associated protein Cas4 [Candidimonas nitroreducens]OWT64052.1 CRISPR-associated protein Cas4 [Candidimonas nitroreducens]